MRGHHSIRTGIRTRRQHCLHPVPPHDDEVLRNGEDKLADVFLQAPPIAVNTGNNVELSLIPKLSFLDPTDLEPNSFRMLQTLEISPQSFHGLLGNVGISLKRSNRVIRTSRVVAIYALTCIQHLNP